MKILCIYHGNCADGFTAAWVVHKALGDNVEFHAGVYQNPPPDVTGRDVIIVDFSYKRPIMEEIANKAKSLTWLDHHKSAIEDMKDFYRPFSSMFIVTDMDRSGAGIAWDHFFHGQPRPFLVDIVEDRDLWRFNLPESRAINAAVFSYEYSFENWDRLNAMDPEVLATEGRAIERKHHRDIKELLKVLQREMVIGGHTVPVANLPYVFSSDAGHVMAQGKPFAACYYDKPTGREFSLRSTDEGLDVSEIAKQYGGGGHRNAAGFRVPYGHELTL